MSDDNKCTECKAIKGDICYLQKRVNSMENELRKKVSTSMVVAVLGLSVSLLVTVLGFQWNAIAKATTAVQVTTSQISQINTRVEVAATEMKHFNTQVDRILKSRKTEN